MFVKGLIVDLLERACSVVDRTASWPYPLSLLAEWFGCPKGLADWSARLDDHWQTSIWSNSPREND